MIANSLTKLKRMSADFRQKMKSNGLISSIRWLVQAIRRLPYRHIEYLVLARSLQDPLPESDFNSSINMRQAAESDLGLFSGLIPNSTLEHFRHRLNNGRHCFIALDGVKLAAYCWASTQIEYKFDNIEITLKPGDAYLDDAFTLPAYRRKGIQKALHLYRLVHMRKLGCRRAVLVVRDNNLASRKLLENLGYKPADWLSFRRILWWRTYRYRDGRF
jgi:ribosomal protein S18 acetylase RimI-like enzyme